MTATAESGLTTPSTATATCELVALRQLREQAKGDPKLRNMLLILAPNNRPHNVRWLDPHLGVMEFAAAPGKAVWIDDLESWTGPGTVGLFTD